MAAVRYVEQNPVRAGLVHQAEDYPYSSANSHVYKEPDSLCAPFFLWDEIKDWQSYLATPISQKELSEFPGHGKSGRPLEDSEFIKKLEMMTGQMLRKQKPGPKGTSKKVCIPPLCN